MRIGIININKLVKIRKSFRLRWRAVTVLLFLLYAYSWWMGLVSGYTSGDDFLLPKEDVRVQTWIFFTALCILAFIAFFRKDDFARLFFAIASSFCVLNTLLMAVWPMKKGIPGVALSQGASPELTLGIVLFVLLLTWKFLILYSYVLWLSLIPYGPGRACRQQVIHSLRAASVGKKNIKTHRRNKVSNNASSKKAFIRFLALGSVAVVSGLLSLMIASMVSVNDDLAKAIHHLELFKAFNIMRNFDLASLDQGDVSGEKVLWLNVFIFFGYFNFVVFSFLWNRWRRSKILIDRTSSPKYIPPSSLLLLRHSKDDVAWVPKRKFKLSRLPFLAFQWNYTFEELIAERLAFIGPLYSLGSKRDESPMFNEALEWLKSKINKRPYVVLRWLGLGIEKLRQSLPNRLSPEGATRFYLDDEKWRSFVRESMSEARAIVVLIGSVKDNKLESIYLQEELAWIKENGYLEKTIFLMPPHLSSWKTRARWRTFAEYLLGTSDFEKVLLKAKQVLGVCFYMHEPVIVTGSERSEFFYESALDIAGTFAGIIPEQRGEMIMKHRTFAPSLI